MTDELIIAGSIPIAPAKSKAGRIALMLWGSSGSGKTTFACTAPGKKLLLMFDPDGHSSITHRDDVDVADFSVAANNIVERFKSETDPLGIAKALASYDTIIVDSLTSIQYKTLMHGVVNTKGATVERPSLQGYGIRNALTLALMKNLLRVTAKENKHIIFLSHETNPSRDEDGLVIPATIMLGGQLSEQTSIDLSEVWRLRDDGKKHYIGIRQTGMYKPMKTRMFSTGGGHEFPWNFDPEKLTGEGLNTYYDAWKANQFQKIGLPK